jgi:hypothetical protein
MKLEKTITIYATDEARKKWEGKELPVKNKKFKCPSCSIEELKKKDSINNDYNKEEKEE